jgi:hypothetical protein
MHAGAGSERDRQRKTDEDVDRRRDAQAVRRAGRARGTDEWTDMLRAGRARGTDEWTDMLIDRHTDEPYPKKETWIGKQVDRQLDGNAHPFPVGVRVEAKVPAAAELHVDVAQVKVLLQ